MMPLSTFTGFRNELVDITEQITRLTEHRVPILEANTMYDLGIALERLEHSMDVLRACVTGLHHRLKLKVSWPEE